jgi:hypothetical protein
MSTAPEMPTPSGFSVRELFTKDERTAWNFSKGAKAPVIRWVSLEDVRLYGAACAAAEREACAKVCDEKATRNFPWGSENSEKYHAQADWAEHIAWAIRARGPA